MSLILASGSPRRKVLLARFGLDFSVIPSSKAERAPCPSEDAASYALSLAREKANDVASRHPDSIVLAADTVVVTHGEILGKPSDPDDAMKMLALLSGRTHTVITGLVLHGSKHFEGTVSADVAIKKLDGVTISAYVDSGEPMDKAGAYAIQGRGGTLVEKVVGCRLTVIGLPLCLTYSLMRQCALLDQLPPGAECVHLS